MQLQDVWEATAAPFCSPNYTATGHLQVSATCCRGALRSCATCGRLLATICIQQWPSRHACGRHCIAAGHMGSHPSPWLQAALRGTRTCPSRWPLLQSDIVQQLED